MAVSVLSKASRLNSGSDLWVVPPVELSQQTLEIDWYLNFQITQSLLRTQPKWAESLKEIVQQSEAHWSMGEVPSSGKLMISAENTLPCRWVVRIDMSKDLHLWTKDLYDIWTSLKNPSLRLFLPPQVTTQKWLTEWKKFSSFEDVSVVLDS